MNGESASLNNEENVSIEVLTAMNMKITVVWNMTLCTFTHAFGTALLIPSSEL
jgi:hypothetical protein